MNSGIAEDLFRAVESGDLDALTEIYAEDVVFGTNLDSNTMNRDEAMALISHLSATIPDYTYTEIRCESTASGFVREHVATGTSPDGARFSIPICCVGEIRDGKVRRVVEYFDSAAVASMGL